MTSLSRRAFLAVAAAFIPAYRLRAVAVTLDEFMELSERLLGKKNLDRETGQIYLNALNADADSAVTLAYLVQRNQALSLTAFGGHCMTRFVYQEIF